MGFEVLTSGALSLVTILSLIMAVVLHVGSTKLTESQDFEDETTSVNSGYGDLRTAYILAYIATALAFVLGAVYGVHAFAWKAPHEWIHGFLFLALVVLLIISGIYAFNALDKINNPNQDKNNADGYIWAGLLVGLFALLTTLGSGVGRLQYRHSTQRVEKAVKSLESALPKMNTQMNMPMSAPTPTPQPAVSNNFSSLAPAMGSPTASPLRPLN